MKSLQGEDEQISQNTSLGIFELTDISPAPAGTPQINLSFAIDSNGMVHVQAFDQKSGAREAITIINTDGLSEEELEVIKNRLERNEEPEIQPVLTEPEQTPKDSKQPETIESTIRNDLNTLQTLLSTHEARLAQRTVTAIAKFQDQVEQLLASSNDSSSYPAISVKLKKLVSDLNKQLSS